MAPSDKMANIVRSIRSCLEEEETTVSIKVVREKCAAAGYSAEQVDKCLSEYENLNVWSINHNRTKLTLI